MNSLTAYSSYYQIVESFVDEIINTWDMGSYQGDYIYLAKNDGRYALISVGYGSCSGCDILENIKSNIYFESRTEDEGTQDIIDLRDDLERSVIWRSWNDMVEYIREKDFSLEWYAFYKEETNDMENFLHNYFK